MSESYITHVRITEDSSHPASRPPPNSSSSSKKKRVIVVAVRKSGRVRVHKARENPDGTFQIGKTWNLDELTRIENDQNDNLGFRIFLGKAYYWSTNSQMEKTVFLNSIVKIYKKYTQGQIPQLEGLGGIIDPTLLQNGIVVHERQAGNAGAAANTAIASSHPGPPQSVPPAQQLPPQSGPPPRQVPPNSSTSPKQFAPQSSIPPQQPVQQSNIPPQQFPPAQHRPSNASSTSRASPPTALTNTEIPQGSPVPVARQRSGSVATANSFRQPSANAPLNIPPKQKSTMPSHGTAPLIIPRSNNVVQGPISAEGSPSDSIRSAASFVSQNHHGDVRKGPVIRTSTSGSSSSAQPDKQPDSKRVPPLVNASTGTSRSNINIAQSQRSADLESSASKSATDSIGNTPVAYIESDAENNSPVEVSRTRSRIADLPTFHHPHEETHEVIEIDDSANSTLESMAPVDIPENFTNADDTLLHAQDSSISVPKRNSGIFDVKFHARAEEQNEVEATADSAPLTGEAREKKDFVPAIHSTSGGRRTHHRKKSSISSTGSRRSYGGRRISFSAMSNASAVDETLAEFNWTGRNDAEYLEKHINEELNQIELAGLHSIVDLDTQLDDLDKSLEDAVVECDRLDAMIAFFSVQLDGVSEDISNIESQEKGLQVQTASMKNLWNELQKLLRTVTLSDGEIEILQTSKFDTFDGLENIESALTILNYALLTVRQPDNERSTESLSRMRAMQERRAMVESTSRSFCSRFSRFCEMQFRIAMSSAEKTAHSSNFNEDSSLKIVDAKFVEMVYPLSGVIIFVRDTDENTHLELIKQYQMLTRPYYTDAFTAYISRVRLRFSGFVKNAEKFSFISSKRNVTTVERSMKRSGTLAKLASDLRDKPQVTVSEEDELRWALDPAALKGAVSILKEFFNTTTKVVLSQQEVLIQLFHMSSYGGESYANYLQQHPLKNRIREAATLSLMKKREIDPNRSKAQEMLVALQSIFGNLQEQIVQLADSINSTCIVMLPVLMFLLDRNRMELRGSNMEYLQQVYVKTWERAALNWNKFIADQIGVIEGTIVSSKKRRGILFFVKTFPRLVEFLEHAIRTLGFSEGSLSRLETRKTVDDGYTRLSKAIFSNLQRLAKDPPALPSNTSSSLGLGNDTEIKEVLNYHIMMIENMGLLKDELALPSEQNPQLRLIVDNAQEQYRWNLTKYADMVLHRPFGKLMDFVQGAQAIQKKGSSEPLSKHHNYNRSALKKVLANYDSKEIRKSVEVLRKRVEKHFSGGEDEASGGVAPTTTNPVEIQLINKVWTALQAETGGLYNGLMKIIDQNYSGPSESVSVEFTKQDIVSAFNRYYK